MCSGQLSILLYFSCRVHLYSDMVSRKQIYLLFFGIAVPDLKCRNLCENTKMNIEKNCIYFKLFELFSNDLNCIENAMHLTFHNNLLCMRAT